MSTAAAAFAAHIAVSTATDLTAADADDAWPMFMSDAKQACSIFGHRS